MVTPRAAHAQIPSLDDYGSGTKYIIAFPDTTSNRLDSRYPNNRFKDAWSLFLYSAVANNRVKVTSGGGASTNLTLQAGKFVIHEVKSNPVVTRINSIESNTITIESDYPVIVYCYCAQRQGMEAWTPVPVDMWGTEYNAAAIPGQVVGQIGLADETAIPFDRSPGPAEILVIAAYDNTKVTIRPKGWQTLLDSRMPVEVTLKAGQCYQVQSVVDTNADFGGDQVDLGGVSIRADKPIGVVSGNTRTFVRQDQQGLVMNAYKNMLIEWLAPTEQHGTEFVFMPSWDSHRPGINSPSERVSEYVRIYGTSAKDVKQETQFYQLQQGGDTKVNNTVPQDSLREFEYASPVAVYYKTADPAQAMMHSSSILQLVSKTPCFNNIPCQTFEAWAPYMVELTPREQWPSFAPFYAPIGPAAPMQHFINVVTDTLSTANIVDETGRSFPFNRRIPGTDLIWGSQTVAPGVDHYLYGKNGAKFAGFVYGFYKGGEQYRPGRTKKSDGNVIAGGDDEIENPLHPCEYEEYNALSYGYPLAPLRKVLKPADSLEIIETMDCTEKTVKIRTLNANPVGLRSITLDPTSVVNAKLIPVNPAQLSDVLGKTSVELKIVPLNPLKDASAKLIIKDRTGKIWYVTYVYQAERIDVEPDSVIFGSITAGDFKDAVVTYTNPLDKDVEVKEVKFTSGFSGTPGADGFEITSTEPSGPAEKPAKSIFLKKGETFTVHLRLNAKTLNKLYEDSLKVILGCVQIAIPIRGETVEPLIMVNDLNFGTFIEKSPAKTMEMKVCNIGRGFVSFENGTDDVLKWLDASGLFTVPQAEIDALKALKLGPGDCYTMHVTFTPTKTGIYSVTARFFANTRKTKDTSAWTAVVTRPGPQITGYDWQLQWVVPGTSDNCTKNTEVAYSTLVKVTNDGSADITVQSVSLVGKDADDGYFVLDPSAGPEVRIDAGESVAPGNPTVNFLAQRVLFMPKGRPNPERTYRCTVRLIAASLNGVQVDTVEAFLLGEGIESHGKITGAVYDSVKFAGASVVHGTKTAYVTALPKRDLHITEVRMTGPDAANYRVVALKRPLPTPAAAWTLKPGETDSVTIEFVPQTFGLKNQAKVEFVGDHAFCDGTDSTADVYGYTFTVGLQTTGIAFGPMLTCRDSVSEVTVANIGSEDVTVTDIRRTDNSGFFEMTLPDVPLVVKVGETIKIPVKFSPNKIGDFNETITFDAVDSKGAPVQITPNPVLVSGGGFILTVPAHIDRNFRAYPGNTITTPVILDGELDEAEVDNLFIGIRYDNKMLKMKNGDTLVASLTSLLTGTLLEGWTVRIVESDHPEGEYLAIFTAPQGKFLTGKGTLLNLKFLTYLGSVDSSKINVNILLVGRQCAKVLPTPGLARVDSICGLNLRLIESTGFDYSLAQNKPNPFNPTTDITFSLGLDGPTTMVVYDASGKKVATLIDGVLKPGTYSVTWNAEGYPSGLYYYRLQSGDWTKTETMILRK